MAIVSWPQILLRHFILCIFNFVHRVGGETVENNTSKLNNEATINLTVTVTC